MSCCPTIFIMTENSKIADRAELSEKLPKWAFSIYFFCRFFFLFLDFCFGDRKAYFTICTFSVLMAIPLERPSHGAFALAQPKTRRGKLLPHCRIEQKTSLSQSQSKLAADSHNNWPRRRWERERKECYASVQTSHSFGFPNSRGNPLSLFLFPSLFPPRSLPLAGENTEPSVQRSERFLLRAVPSLFARSAWIDSLYSSRSDHGGERERGRGRGWGSWG